MTDRGLRLNDTDDLELHRIQGRTSYSAAMSPAIDYLKHNHDNLDRMPTVYGGSNINHASYNPSLYSHPCKQDLVNCSQQHSALYSGHSTSRPNVYSMRNPSTAQYSGNIRHYQDCAAGGNIYYEDNYVYEDSIPRQSLPTQRNSLSRDAYQPIMQQSRYVQTPPGCILDEPCTSRSSTSSDISQTQLTEYCIYLKNNVAVNLSIASHNAKSEYLIDIIISEQQLKLSSVAKEVFQLWLVSPLLEVQLKPEHQPLSVRQQWKKFLSKYTAASVEEIETDYPMLLLQRNVFYPKEEERKIEDEAIIELLYEEAKCNIVDGKYPCTPNEAHRLAAMQARIELGKYDPDTHSPDFFRSRLKSYLPVRFCKKSSWSIFNFGTSSKTGVEHQIIDIYRTIIDEKTNKDLMMEYLEFCWKFSYYGSAFFSGQVENPQNGLASLLLRQDMLVLMAISSDGISIIDVHDGEIVLSICYEELSWDFTKPTNEDADCLPCLFVQFQVIEHGQRVSKILQVFSKQAAMMDALITSFVQELHHRAYDRSDCDGLTPGDSTPDADDADTPLTTASSRHYNPVITLSNKIHRLSLATFNEEGDCIQQTGSWAVNR